MIDKTIQNELLLGKEARMVLDNAAFKQAMQSLKDSVLAQWKDCPIRDREGQLLLLQLAKMTDKFESILVGMVERGEFEQRKIDIDRERDESRASRVVRKFGF